MTELGPAFLKAADVVALGESGRSEFKLTLRINPHTGSDDKRTEHACLKTIAAFLNTHGGYLLIGVSDKGEPLGIERDRFPREDEMHQHLFNLLGSQIGREYLLPVEARFETLGGNRVFLVHCQRSKRPVFLRDGKMERFFLRAGPTTVELLPSEFQRYIKQRFDETD